ncbi:MAG: LysR family transcriptional regulator [Proteobacteria bacterium]|nr:LysR family transcriptional regulator [Pseudomonadota bacterium]
MDIRRLEIFLKLIETRSFSKTALELHLTQPTVSGHIKTLEQQVGLRLFDRHQRGVLPTSAALVLEEYAWKILDMQKEAGYALEKYRGRIQGRLRLGGSTIPGGYILPILMGRFRNRYEETFLDLTLDDTRGVLDQLAAGGIEIGMVGARMDSEVLDFEPSIEDEMVLALPPGPEWSEWKNTIPIEALTQVPFIVREEGSGTRTAMLAALHDRGFSLKDLKMVAQIGGTEAVLQAVKSGLGASILSRIAAAQAIESGAVRTVRVKGLDLKRRFYIVTHQYRTRSPVCNAFLEFLKAEAETLTPNVSEME